MKLARLGDGPEIFFSLQGEGKNQGAPSVFVRTTRCNLYCTWCDTPYTWNWQGSSFVHAEARKYDPVAETIELSPAAVAQWVRRWPCLRVVLTGGEPLLQAAELSRLVESLRALDPAYQIEIETNGTVIPPAELDALVNQYTVSPKLANSKVEQSLRLRHEALLFLSQSPKSVFKFVIAGSEDAAEVALLSETYGINPDRIYLMPQGTTSAALQDRSPLVSSLCLDRGYRFSDRLHIHLFGNRPGV